MKKILSITQNSNATHLALLIARVGIGALMLTHGLPKMATLFSGEPVQFLPLFGMSAEFSLGLTVFAEVLCSIFIIAGFATRLAVIPQIITMLVALVFVHAADPIGKQEPALHYLLVDVVLLLAGSGKYSLDALLLSKKTKTSGKLNVKDATLAI